MFLWFNLFNYQTGINKHKPQTWELKYYIFCRVLRGLNWRMHIKYLANFMTRRLNPINISSTFIWSKIYWYCSCTEPKNLQRETIFQCNWQVNIIKDMSVLLTIIEPEYQIHNKFSFFADEWINEWMNRWAV